MLRKDGGAAGCASPVSAMMLSLSACCRWESCRSPRYDILPGRSLTSDPRRGHGEPGEAASRCSLRRLFNTPFDILNREGVDCVKYYTVEPTLNLSRGRRLVVSTITAVPPVLPRTTRPLRSYDTRVPRSNQPPKANLSKKNDLRATAASNVASHIGMLYRTFAIHPHPTLSRISLRRDHQSGLAMGASGAHRPAAFARRRLAAAAAMSRMERTSI